MNKYSSTILRDVDIEFKVKGKPPYKQAPADSSERINKKTYRDSLIAEAKKHFTQPNRAELKIDVSYLRGDGRADAMNIIGGIADSLEGIAYHNDRQLVEVHYRERRAVADEYVIRIYS